MIINHNIPFPLPGLLWGEMVNEIVSSEKKNPPQNIFNHFQSVCLQSEHQARSSTLRILGNGGITKQKQPDQDIASVETKTSKNILGERLEEEIS